MDTPEWWTTFLQWTFTQVPIELPLIALHQNVAGSFRHLCDNFYNIPLSGYRVMKFHSLKNRPKLTWRVFAETVTNWVTTEPQLLEYSIN